ncbi:uncharacterized protein G2W53_018741 [Senna tora]|uniref:Uncharacterized protein n=1 Tax=Senna tora TaxID=362788 RepID=A0A834TU65_9FABA|nr:uncharacterized protein G2W53_018741 [Senna tora]
MVDATNSMSTRNVSIHLWQPHSFLDRSTANLSFGPFTSYFFSPAHLGVGHSYVLDIMLTLSKTLGKSALDVGMQIHSPSESPTLLSPILVVK